MRTTTAAPRTMSDEAEALPSRAGLPPPKGLGWTGLVRAPDRLDEGLDRDLDDLRRVLTVLRELGVRGWIDYKRDCDTARGLYGRGALYWHSPPGTVAIDVPRGRSAGRWTARLPPSLSPRLARTSGGPGAERRRGVASWREGSLVRCRAGEGLGRDQGGERVWRVR
ncbi:hypothetical protein ACIBO6_02500 [Streptomyces luteogriseus]|uniref:hypothetical protein n=1 Tax=Streptomyces luteogriseus TaxID=68233 RepID=UPI0037933334